MKLLNEANDSRFVTRKLNTINDQWNENDVVRNGIMYNTEVLKCNVSEHNDAYILVRGDITVVAAGNESSI